MKVIRTIASKGEHYTAAVFLYDDGSGGFTGDADIDIDGSPDWRRDPYGQEDTTLHLGGKPVNGQEFAFIVLPPEVINAYRGIVLGCKASVGFAGRLTDAVVADVGPHSKLGEISPKCARDLFINDNPNTGGVDSCSVSYRFWPGVPAILNGTEFDLMPYGS